MKRKAPRLFFDANDYKLLAIVNDVLDWVRSLAVTSTGAPDEAWDMSLSSIDAWNQWLDDSGQNCVIRFSIDYRARI